MEEIWIHPEFKRGGYSTVLDYEDDHLSVSLGGANAYGFNNRVIFIALRNIDFRVIGADAEFKEYCEALNGGKSDIAFRIIVRHLDQVSLKQLVTTVYERGIRDGRNQLRKDLSQLLHQEL